MKKQDVRGAQIIDPASDKLIATSAELMATYIGPQSLLLLEGADLVAISILGGAYSYDFDKGKYRWTLQRPLVEKKVRFLEKLQGLQRMQKTPIGIGFAFNGVKGAPPIAHLRGVWLPNCHDMHEGLTFGAQGHITDLVIGYCDKPEVWNSPPTHPLTMAEY